MLVNYNFTILLFGVTLNGSPLVAPAFNEATAPSFLLHLRALVRTPR